MQLELEDGYTLVGQSYGAEVAVSGELVFQTGMVGYSESLTDPSYRGQILVCTFPLVGNYGVPSRSARDALLPGLPAHFEAAEIHVAGLVTASYTGENYSHYLAGSSLGAWLRENGVPAIHGVDTRALTKRIRSKGSLLGRLLLPVTAPAINGVPNGSRSANGSTVDPAHVDFSVDRRLTFRKVPWLDPNERNLVSEGKR